MQQTNKHFHSYHLYSTGRLAIIIVDFNLKMSFLMALVVAIVAIGQECECQSSLQDLPNIVVMIADDLGIGDLGCCKSAKRVDKSSITMIVH